MKNQDSSKQSLPSINQDNPKQSPSKNTPTEVDLPLSDQKTTNSAGKVSYLRDLTSLKILMEKRHEQRGMTLYYYTKNQNATALINCRQLTFSSTKIYKQYMDEYNEQFEQNFFVRTSKAKQHLQYLLDAIIACKVFLQGKKKEDAIDVLEKIELNQNQIEKGVIINTEMDKVRFNQRHQIMSKMCAVLLTLVQIAKSQKLHDYCEKFYQIYVKYVENNYGIIEYSTSLFKYGTYLYDIKNYEKAQKYFRRCVEIRKKIVINSCLVDALINLAICQRELSMFEDAIQNTRDAIQIYKDIKINDQGIDRYYLFLAKLNLQAGSFEQSYVNFLKCYKYRSVFDNSNPAKTQIQINFMQFFKVLKDVVEKPRDVLNIDDKNLFEERRKEAQTVYEKMKTTILQREQFSKYRDFKSSKFSHLDLVVTQELFDSMSANHLIELNSLLEKLGDLTFARGMAQLHKCSFYQEKKLRDILIQANPHIKKTAKRRGSNTNLFKVG